MTYNSSQCYPCFLRLFEVTKSSSHICRSTFIWFETAPEYHINDKYIGCARKVTDCITVIEFHLAVIGTLMSF